ncbi:ABC transporter permease [Streptomyces sp. NPDC127098]|uniref:ABC transporter permease n=1 Tax=Streptomyces sp. NPDC127098 TaxID=3347137 RepID=UPI00365E524C
MNFVKRAALSLLARKGKTVLLLGILLVICALLLGGLLLRGATARQEAEAQRRIGVAVTVRGDELTTDAADLVGAAPPVVAYNPVLRGVTASPGLTPVTSELPEPPEAAADPERNGLALAGVRDSGLLLAFASGRSQVVSGRALTERDAGHRVVMVEERLAELNGLAVGDTVELATAEGEYTVPFEIVGVHRSPRGIPGQWTAPRDLPANQLYAPVAAVVELGFGDRLSEAVFRVESPEAARPLRDEVARVLGPDGFRFDVNDKAYLDLVRPIQRVGAFAGALVWLISVAGAVTLGLIVALTIRERRHEMGMLLSLGERRWKLVGQHAVEVMAVALVALAVVAPLGLLLAPTVGERLLPSDDDGVGSAEVRMAAADLGRVAGIGLGISLVSTVFPGLGILRLHPRSILTDSE